MVFTPAPALAGAWIAPPEGQQIWTNAVGESDAGLFDETSAYWEQPIEPRVAFVATLGMSTIQPKPNTAGAPRRLSV